MKHKNEDTKPEESNEKTEPQKPQADAEPVQKEIQQLQQQIEQIQKEKTELFKRLQRLSADYANFQKRAAKNTTETICYETEKIIATLLPVLDSFEHTLANIDTTKDLTALVAGVKIIYDQMLDIFKLYNVEQIEAAGKKFDPLLHEALVRKTDQTKEDLLVLEEFQKGYKVNGKVIRPAKVVVNRLQKVETQEDKQIQEQKPEPAEQEETTDVE